MRFSVADPSCIETLETIENEFFSEYNRAYNASFFDKWYKYNPDLIYVVKDDVGQIMAFTILAPISNALYCRVKMGMISDMMDFSEKDVYNVGESDTYFVADICVSKRLSYGVYYKAVACLMSGIVLKLRTCKKILASPITKEGKRLCKSIGFVKVSEEVTTEGSYEIWELLVTQKRVSQFDRLLSKYN